MERTATNLLATINQQDRKYIQIKRSKELTNELDRDNFF